LAPGALLDADEAERLIEMAGCGKTAECPQMRLREALRVDEGEGFGKETAADPAPAQTVLHDEPAQMRNPEPRSSPSMATDPTISSPRVALQIALRGLSSRSQKAASPPATTVSKRRPKPEARA
jgi:hypothetical protein